MGVVVSELAGRGNVRFRARALGLDVRDRERAVVQRLKELESRGLAFEAAEGSMSKLKAGEVCVWVTERAIQIAGGIGYVREAPLERWHRDSKVYTIFEGTSEIQQLVIARAISGLRLQ